MGELGALFLRPDRSGDAPRVESIIDTVNGQLSLERHGAHTMPGVVTRIAQRLLALAAGLWHNWNVGEPGLNSPPTTTETQGPTESVI